MSLFNSAAKRKKRQEDSAKQKERELRYRGERDHWRQIAKTPREFLSRRYLRGQGIEIGGLHRPLKLYEGATARYVDRISAEELKSFYPKVAGLPQVKVDIVDDGETLRTIADESVDFVVANHMLEHTRNPIATVQNFLRVTKPGGHLFMAIPDKRFTFDIKRQVTPFAHLREDYLKGPEISDREHYVDWATNVREFPDEAARGAYIDECHANLANIHFHVWTFAEIVEMFFKMRDEFAFPLELESAIHNGDEIICVLKKSGARDEVEAVNEVDADTPGL